ncbi:MAG: phosphopantothenoylcysteine decarboxylase/phosphopantothenate--cysteine ligase [Gammaproteobacteria bacterium]|jgi:phosphopantothenoylcysteine decarboxylase/phosphopantothenate--cysteine ligase
MLAKGALRIVVGVTGGIAAYKSPDVIRRLKDRGHDVRVVMTSGAMQFITPLTLQAVSGEPVHQALLDERAEAGMGHIELARWADLVLIAPATANCMALLAGGHANDLLTTICLATTAPIAIAPAMNQQMWQAVATQANLRLLEQRGVEVFGPGTGVQACGDVGAGRMLEALEIAAAVERLQMPTPLANLSVLVSAGPTREAIDPVRYISNHSSGKMGYAVAQAARQLGATVSLVTGPTNLAPPAGMEVVQITTAAQMYDAVMARAPAADVFVSAAAVADYAPAQAADRKLKKHAANMAIELVRTRDVLAAVSALEAAPFTVGFAAETNDMRANAGKKLASKSLDMIAGNDVAQPGIGFNGDENALTVVWEDGEVELPRAAKTIIAQQLMELVAERYHGKRTTAGA